MDYTVSYLSKLTGVSKVSIYNKLKLKEMKQFTHKIKGVTYISEEGLNLIKERLNLNNEVAASLNGKEEKQHNSTDKQEFKDSLNSVNDYINYLKNENEKLWIQIDEKDKQIQALHKLVENSQVLLKDTRMPEPLLLEEHFQELNKKIENIKENMNKRTTEVKTNSFWDKFKIK